MPKILEKIYPLSKKLEKIVVVSGRKTTPIVKNINHHLRINNKSEENI